MRNFYSNIGRKVQLLAKFSGGLGVVSIVAGIVLLFVEALAGVAALATGLALMLSSFPLYAFGQITEDVREMKKSAKRTVGKFINDLPEL